MTEHNPSDEVLHLAFKRDEGNWPPFDAEEVRGRRLEGERFQVLTTPTFTRELAVGDIVETSESGGHRWVRRVVEFGDHSTVRVILRGGTELSYLNGKISELGCVAQPTSLDGLVKIDVGPEVNYADLTRVLNDGLTEGIWEYEEGAISQNHR